MTPAGFQFSVSMPSGLAGDYLRWQALVLMYGAGNGLFALTNAHDIRIQG